MRPDSRIERVYLHRAPVDFRKQMDGLAALVEQVMPGQALSGSLFVFINLGIDLGRASMANWMIKLGQGVVPLINLIDERIRAGPLIHCDETPVQVLNSPGSDRHWMWVRAGGPPGEPMVVFDHDPSRGTAVPKRLLAECNGLLMTDGYEPYDAVARAGALTHAGCWAYVRRYFNDAQRSGGKTDGHAARVLDDIKALYRIEPGTTSNGFSRGITTSSRRGISHKPDAPFT